MQENRETSGMRRSDPGRVGEGAQRNSDMYVSEESDSAVVPMNQPNKEDLPSDERIRALTKIEDCADAEFYIIEQTGNRIKGTARIQRRLGYAKSRDAHEVISEI